MLITSHSKKQSKKSLQKRQKRKKINKKDPYEDVKTQESFEGNQYGVEAEELQREVNREKQATSPDDKARADKLQEELDRKAAENLREKLEDFYKKAS